jgi:hypothetical protein
MLSPSQLLSSVPSIGQIAAPHVNAPLGTSQGDSAKLTADRTSGAGISNIAKNIEGTGFGQKYPFLGKVAGVGLQGLATLGDTLAESASPIARMALSNVPGTFANHQHVLNQDTKALGTDTATEEKSAQIGNLQADIPYKQAQTEATRANTAAKPAEDAAKQALTDAQIQNLLHPQAKTAFEDWRRTNPDAPTADFFKAQAEAKPDKPGNDFEQFYKDYITDNNLPDSAHNRLMARKEFAAAGQAPQRPAQVTVVVPNGQGGGTVETLHPGQTVAPGSMSATQLGSQNLTANKTAATEAKTVQNAKDDYQLMQTLASSPSPTNDLVMVMHYIGATKPESMGKIRLNQNEMSLVMGTRSTLGDLQALGEKVQSGQMLTPKQRQDMLATMRILSSAQGTQSSGKGVSLKDAMALPQNAGKSEADVRKDIELHGHTVVQ